MKKKQLIILISLVVAAFALAVVFIIISTNKKGYESIPVKEGPIKEAIYGLGTVVSSEKFSFKVGVTKTLDAIYVKKGDEVKKGDAVLKFTDGMIVKAPLNGTVLEMPFNVGENVFADKPAVTIENLHSLYIEARIDQEGALRVKSGLPVKLSFENLRNKVFEAKVQSIFPNQGEFVARINIDSLPPEILPGMTVDVAIEVANKARAVLIPVRAISSHHVLRERGGSREKIPVEIGISDDEWAEVTKGDIRSGDEVLIKR